MASRADRAPRLVTLEILDPGPLASVQDVVGRGPWRRFGVPAGGAADPWSARLANRLVGNDDEAAVVELTLGGGAVRVEVDAAIAVAGGLEASVDGLPLGPNAARAVRAGATLRFERGSGARVYLAVTGGIRVEPVMGSAATDLRTGFGGHDGRALRPGDRLSVIGGEPRPRRWLGAWESGPIRIAAGPHAAALPIEELTDATWRVGAEADRTGVRLDGPPLAPSEQEIPSMGLALGAIQVPPDGRPIVMLADRPVTGGYPVPAAVIGADAGRVARLRPGDPVRFRSVSVDEARAALGRALAALNALEALEASDDGIGWAGSHR